MTNTSTTPLSFVHRWEPARDGGDGLTILALHGTGGDESDMLPLVRRMAPDAAVLSPRGRVMEGPMPRFFRRLREGVFDLDSLARETEALGDFVDAAAAHYGFDRERVVAVGYSNGANVGASLLLRRPGALVGGLLLRAMVPFEPATPPVPRHGVRPRVVIADGRVDPIVPAEQAERLAQLLAQAGCDARVEWLPTGHQIVPRDLEIGQALVDELRRAA